MVFEAKTPYGVKVKAFYYQDVKEAVLEFEKILKGDLLGLFGKDEYEQPHIQELLQDYKKIFGDWEK